MAAIETLLAGHSKVRGFLNKRNLVLTIAGFTFFNLFVRWYQAVYGWSAGLDTFAPKFRTYWMNWLYIETALYIPLFAAIGVYLWKTRVRDMDALTSEEVLTNHFHHLVWLVAYGIAIYWGASFYTEQDGTWHQTVIRDTDFTPSHIIQFYMSYPIYILTGWGAFMYARTRIPCFSKGVSLPYLVVTVGPFMILPNVGLNEWGHTFWWMEELFVAPLHYGFVFFGWMTLGLCGLLLQIFEDIGNLVGPTFTRYAFYPTANLYAYRRHPLDNIKTISTVEVERVLGKGTADTSNTAGVLADAHSEGFAAVKQNGAHSIPEQTTTESAGRGSWRDSLLPDSMKGETEMFESYVDTARELSDVFRHLVHERPVVVTQFLHAFAERSRYQELPESLGLTIGIQRVLSFLLRGIPPTEQLAAYDRLSAGERTDFMDNDISNFETHISSALQALARDNTLTLSRYKTNLRRLAITPERYVGALLLDYVHCKSMYPY